MISGRKAAPLFLALAIALTICNAYAQGTGTPPPPPCCKGDRPQGGEDSVPVSITADSSTVVTVSDATLREQGLTRGQFLDLMAKAMFADSDTPILLVIPVVKQVQAPDGSASYEVTYYSILKSEATAELLGATSALYITDGRTVVGVNFISDPKS
jgi:hypothetical protein